MADVGPKLGNFLHVPRPELAQTLHGEHMVSAHGLRQELHDYLSPMALMASIRVLNAAVSPPFSGLLHPFFHPLISTLSFEAKSFDGTALGNEHPAS